MEGEKPEFTSLSMSGAAYTPAHTPAGTPRKMLLSGASPHIPDDIIKKYENIGKLFTMQVKALKVIKMCVPFFKFFLFLHHFHTSVQSTVIVTIFEVCINFSHFQEQQRCQIESIKVNEFYKDARYDENAPYDLHGSYALSQDRDTYIHLGMCNMTYHLRYYIDAYNCTVL